MKKLILLIHFGLCLALTTGLHAQVNKEIIGIWEFQTMTSVYYSEPEEITSTDRDKNHRETLTFRGDGTFSYRGVYEGVDGAGIGAWRISKVKLTMDVNGEKTICNCEVDEDIMTLILNEDETDEFYGMNSVLKYKKRIISPKSYKKKKRVK